MGQAAPKRVALAGRRVARSSTCMRTACSPRSRSACRASTRRASRRRRSCSAPNGSRRWTSAASTSGAQRQHLLVVLGGSRRSRHDVVATHDEGLAAWCKQHPERFVALSSAALQFPDLAAEQLEHAVKNLGAARRVDRRPRRRRAAADAEVRSVLGQGRGARRAGVHAPEQRGEHRARRRARRPRRLRQHRRQSARDDRVPEPHDLRRHARPVPEAQGLRRARRRISHVVSRPQRRACIVRDDANCANKRKPSEYFKDQIVVDSMVFSSEGCGISSRRRA